MGERGENKWERGRKSVSFFKGVSTVAVIVIERAVHAIPIISGGHEPPYRFVFLAGK
jgi:hypothetical protein